jgi:hypothetical protein
MTLPESGIDRFHNALSRIRIWRKLGSPRAVLLLVSSPYAELIRGLRRTRDNAPHKFAMSELACEIRMMWFFCSCDQIKRNRLSQARDLVWIRNTTGRRVT